MEGLVEDYTRQIAELARVRDAALVETTRIAQERDAAKAACDAEAQRIKNAHQALKKTTADLRQTKTYLKDARRSWEEERVKLERKAKLFKNKLALTTAVMEKRLGQAEQREKDEGTDKKELKRLNAELIEGNRRVQREALEAKASREQWRLKYTAALAEKIDLLHRYAPNPVFPVEILANIASFATGSNDYAGVAAMCGTSHLMHAELKPILHETVIWNDCLQTRLLESLDDLDTSEFRQTRFIILDDGHFEFLDECR